MATVCLVLRVFFSCAVTDDATSKANKIAQPETSQRLRTEVIDVLCTIRFLFSNFISELVLYARNFYGLAINNPGLIFEFKCSVERCPVKKA